MGSLLTMPPESAFPPSGDVDFNVVVAQDQPTETFNIPWQGLILEYSVVSRSQYATPEAVLANPELACNLAHDSILADRDGSFRALQREVTAALWRAAVGGGPLRGRKRHRNGHAAAVG